MVFNVSQFTIAKLPITLKSRLVLRIEFGELLSF